MSPRSQTGIQWRTPKTTKLMRDNKIKTRYALHRALEEPKATVYTMFNDDWSGTPTYRFVRLVASRFGVTPESLIEPIPTVKKTRPQRRARTNDQP